MHCVNGNIPLNDYTLVLLLTPYSSKNYVTHKCTRPLHFTYMHNTLPFLTGTQVPDIEIGSLQASRNVPLGCIAQYSISECIDKMFVLLYICT